MKPGFSFRSWVTWLLLFSFGVCAVSGAMLYLRPEGSLAKWVQWTALGLDKKQWEGVHTIFVAVFLVIGLVHLGYNWRPLLAYLRPKRIPGGAGVAGGMIPKEPLAAAAVIGLVWAGSLFLWPPFTALIQWRSAVKDGKFAVTSPPPVADADQLTISQLCVVAGLSPEQVLLNAKSHGLKIQAVTETLGGVAKENGLTPEKAYQLLKYPPLAQPGS